MVVVVAEMSSHPSSLSVNYSALSDEDVDIALQDSDADVDHSRSLKKANSTSDHYLTLLFPLSAYWHRLLLYVWIWIVVCVASLTVLSLLSRTGLIPDTFLSSSQCSTITSDSTSPTIPLQSALEGAVFVPPVAPTPLASPPHTSAASDYTIVIPTFQPHLTVLKRFLESMLVYCPTCVALPLHLIVGAAEVELFNEELLSNVQFAAFNVTIRTLPQISHYWSNRSCSDSEDSCNRGKFVHQSLKKMYGCLDVLTRYCWLVDSESFFIRPTSVEELLLSYMDAPFIVTSSWVRQQHPALLEAKTILSQHESVGWLLEYYLWVMDRDVFARIEALVREKYPTLDSFPQHSTLFIEMVYYAYIVHRRRAYPQYEVIDTINMFGHDWWMEMYGGDPGWSLGPLEDVRDLWQRRESLRPGIIAAFDRYNLTVHKAQYNNDAHEVEAQFLHQAKTVKLLLSEQPEELYARAMKGEFVTTAVENASLEVEAGKEQ